MAYMCTFSQYFVIQQYGLQCHVFVHVLNYCTLCLSRIWGFIGCIIFLFPFFFLIITVSFHPSFLWLPSCPFGEMSSVSSTLVKKSSISISRVSSPLIRKMIHPRDHRTANSVFSSQPQLLLRDSSHPPERLPAEFPSTPSYEPEMPGPPTAPELQPIPPELPADPPPNSPGPNPGPEMSRPPVPSPPGPEVPLPPPDILTPQSPEIMPPKPPKVWPTEPPEIVTPELPELPEIKPPDGPFYF